MSHYSLTVNISNGYICGHSYYRRQIGNRTQAFEWHQFQSPGVTSKPDFKSPYYSSSNNSKMVQDRAVVTMADQWLWSTEPRHFQRPWMTPNPDFKVMPFFDAKYLINGWRYGHSY